MPGEDAIPIGHPITDLVSTYWQAWERRAPSAGFVSIVRLGASRFVSAPDELRELIESVDPASAADLAELLTDHAVQRSGEARLAYADAGAFRSRWSIPTVPIGRDDPRFARLRDAALPEEWGESFGHDDRDHCAGIVEEGALVAIAGYRLWDDALAHVAVFTAASARSRGLATSVASAVVQHALDDGLVAQWRVRLGNEASWRVAQKLGFVEAGRQIFAAFDLGDG